MVASNAPIISQNDIVHSLSRAHHSSATLQCTTVMVVDSRNRSEPKIWLLTVHVARVVHEQGRTAGACAARACDLAVRNGWVVCGAQRVSRAAHDGNGACHRFGQLPCDITQRQTCGASKSTSGGGSSHSSSGGKYISRIARVANAACDGLAIRDRQFAIGDRWAYASEQMSHSASFIQRLQTVPGKPDGSVYAVTH